MSELSQQKTETRCVACREPIQPDARLCPHCRSPQRAQRWQALGAALKWIGGVAAVISLVIGAQRVNEVYEGWRERTATVEELVQASRMLLDARDYESGWAVLDQALILDPTDRPARRLQVDLAMAWLRNIRVSDDVSFSQVVDRLLPVLYRGTSKADPTYAGDVFAHIGWANYLKVRDTGRSFEVDAQYQQALEIDPGNSYAHIHRAHWLLNPLNESADAGTRLEAAKIHIAAGLASGREPDYTADLALRALLGAGARFKGAYGETLRLANELRQTGLKLEKRLMMDFLREIWSPIGIGQRSEKRLGRLMSAVSPDEMLATYRWTLSGVGRSEQDAPEFLFMVARLTEAAGEKESALSLYRTLRSDERTRSLYRDAIDIAIRRLTGNSDSP